MANVTNTLTAVITTEEDTTGNVPINRGTGNPAQDVSVGQFTTYQLLPIGSTSIILPILPTAQVYIKNIDATSGIIVHWVVNGIAGVQLVAVLAPGDQLILWADPTRVNGGITALSLDVSVACLVEYFLGG
jgi:hypothetical protein